jgi:hypothetical protein
MNIDVTPRSNAGTSVNPFGYHDDRPPPGWPNDPTEYGPGEGPRHAEDFHLHEATFPIYALPPDRWDGYAGLSGSGSSGRDLSHVDFGYFDEPGGSARGLEVVNARPGGRRRVRSMRPEDVGEWANDPFPDDDVVNFASRFLSNEERRRLQSSEFGWLDLGPTRIVGIVELEVAGRRVETHRREYRGLPPLRSVAFEVPGTRLTLFGWILTFDELDDFARGLERLELGSELHGALKEAQARTDRRFEELHRHHHHDGS